MAPDVLIHGDTHRSAALRHELPLGIIDPFSYFEVDGRRVVVVSELEAGRIAEAAPGVEVVDPYALGLDELIARGMRWHDIDVELCSRAAARLEVGRLVVPSALPVAVADRLRADGIDVVADELEFIRRRRSKTPAEIEGVRRAQAAADAGMSAAAELLRGAGVRDGELVLDGETLTSEAVRSTIREVCAELGAPAPEDIIVAAGAAGASGHEEGSGPLPAACRSSSTSGRATAVGLLADMTRTFVNGGEPAEDVVAWHGLCRTALERVVEMAGPGVAGASCSTRRARSSRRPAS